MPIHDRTSLNKHEANSKIKQQEYYNSRHRAQPLPPIPSGIEVQVTKDKKPGVVLKENWDSETMYCAYIKCSY